MEKHRLVVDDFALPAAVIVSGTDVVAIYVIIVIYFLPVCKLRIERTVVAVADKALTRFKVAVMLRISHILYRVVF